MAGKAGRKLNILLSTILLALFLYLAFRNVNLGELADILKNTNYFYVVIAGLVGVILGSVVRVFRWRVLLEPIKPNVSFKNMISSTMVGYMVNNLIPRSGEFVRPYLLGKSENISKASAFGTIVIERIIDTVTFLLMFGVCLIFFKRKIANAFPDIDFAVIVLTALIFVLLLAIIFMIVKPEQSLKVFKFIMRILPKKIELKVEKIFESLVNSFSILKRPDLWLMIALYSAGLWIVYVSSTYIAFYSFGIMVDPNTSIRDGFWNANLLLVLINVAMFIPVPAATGPYHYVCKVALTSIFAISEATALGYATATHLINFLIFLGLGLYYFITSHYRISEIKEETI
jgi:glycosyltransferase 2 family protein